MNRLWCKRAWFGSGCVLLMAAWVMRPAFAEDAAPTSADAQPKHVRVIWHSDPATTATVSWTTAGQGASHQVRLKAHADPQWSTFACQRSEQFGGRLKGRLAPYAHHTHLTDLEPATKYHVVCQSDGQSSREYYFLTAPDDNRPVAILFGGDSRSGIDARQKINRLMARMVAEQTAAGRPEILALAHGGDFIVNGTVLEQWLVWLENHEQTTGPDGRLLPIVPARGNHDMGPLFNQVFAFPKDDENYFAVDLSASGAPRDA